MINSTVNTKLNAGMGGEGIHGGLWSIYNSQQSTTIK